MSKKVSYIFFFISFGLIAQDQSDTMRLQSYVNSILGLDYNTAITISNQIDQIELKKTTLLLANTLIDAGQKEVIIPKISKSRSSEAYILYLLSKGYYNLERNPYTLESFNLVNEALFEAKKINHKDLTKLSYKALLDVYSAEIVISDSGYKELIDTYEKVCTKNNDLFWHKINLLNYYYQFLSDENVTKDFFDDFDSFMTNFKENHPFYADYNSNKGVFIELKGNFTEAEQLYLNALNISGDKPYLKYLKFRSYIRLSEIQRKKGNLSKALIYIDSAQQNNDLGDIERSLYYTKNYKARILSSIGNYKDAYQEKSEADSIEVRINYKKNSLQIAQSNVKYRTLEKEKQILEEQSQKKRNQNIAITLGVSLLLLSIIAILILRNTKRKQRIAEQEKALQIQKTTAILKEQEINTINAIVAGQEKERHRLARDLHDNLGGTLAAVKMHIGNLQRNLTTTKNPEELLDKANHLISEAYTSVRSIAHERNSGVMAKDGLLPAVQNLANKVSSSSGLEINVEAFGLDERISNNIEITIFRIIQELVTNIIKHAAATEASISLTQHENELNIFVEDNGCGFIVGKLTSKDGMGLGSIERRIEHLEGTMQVDSTLGKGTNIIVDIPIK